MGTIAVITDSGADFPPGTDLPRTVPLKVRFGDEELPTDQDLTPREFWRRCSASRDLPATSAPSIGEFRHSFQHAANDGFSGILCVTLSSRLSATYQAALAASEQVRQEIPVVVIDSLSVSAGQGLLVREVTERAESETDLSALAAYAIRVREGLRVYATLDTLDHLKRGGRIGTLASLVGSVLSFKPVIEVRDGVVELAERPRTRSRALQSVANRVAAHPGASRAVVLHAQANDVGRFLDVLADASHLKDLPLADLGPVIATHTGPGTVGVALYDPSCTMDGG